MTANREKPLRGDLPMTIGGELTFVKFNEAGKLDTAGFHSNRKREISLLFAQFLAREFSGVLINLDRGITARSDLYAIVEFSSANESYRDVGSGNLERILIRPDVDVVEVNLPPNASIDYFESNIARIYACAREAGLATERTSRGKCIGTRGGLHLTFSVPGESVAARVATMNLALGFIELAFNWPFLSYLFCGDRSGPDGFHPRLDEATSDGIERIQVMRCIAASYRERVVAEPSCWEHIAIAMMHLMRDRFGRSHVVEISLDKLWSPDPSRNLGIVELRQFEMGETDKLAIAQARFAWSIASAINQGKSTLGIFSIERNNPDIMDCDLIRFSRLFVINESSSNIIDLLKISKARYPVLFSIPLCDDFLRLRMGRAETFCEYCEIDGELREIFVPYRVCFSLGLFSDQSAGSTSILSMTLELRDSFFDIREHLLSKASGKNREILDVISDVVKCYFRSEIESMLEGSKLKNGVDLLLCASEKISNRKVKFANFDFKFHGTFNTAGVLNIENHNV
jgi:hypothetical protein